MEYQVISADSHINEPPGTFVDRVPAKLRDRAPHVVETPDGGQGWQFPDSKASSFGLSTAAQWTYKNYRPSGLRFEEIIKGSWDPAEHVKDMKADGCDASVLYFGVAAGCYNMKDPELRVASLRAYNDWLGEFCSHDRRRLIGPPLLPTEEETIEPALEELQRNVKEHEIITAQVPIFPWRRYFDSFYDPLWAMAQETQMPIAFHRGLQRPFAFGSPSEGGPWMANQVMRDFSYTMPVADLIFGGVFDRFPDLKVVASEGRTGWLVHFVQRADESYRRHRHWLKAELKRIPSDYLKENVYSTFIEDRVGVLLREMIGIDNQMWSSDYPHSDSTWPRSQEAIDLQFEGVPDSDRRKMLAENAVRLYRLN